MRPAIAAWGKMDFLKMSVASMALGAVHKKMGAWPVLLPVWRVQSDPGLTAGSNAPHGKRAFGLCQ